MERKKIVLCFGTFDRLHPGHLYYLNEARNHGDELVVVLARDETIEEVKGKKPFYPAAERSRQLLRTGIPHRVVLGNRGDKYDIIEQVRPDIICLGYDQKTFTETLAEELANRGLHIEITRIGPYREDVYKSSKLK